MTTHDLADVLAVARYALYTIRASIGLATDLRQLLPRKRPRHEPPEARSALPDVS